MAKTSRFSERIVPEPTWQRTRLPSLVDVSTTLLQHKQLTSRRMTFGRPSSPTPQKRVFEPVSDQELVACLEFDIFGHNLWIGAGRWGIVVRECFAVVDNLDCQAGVVVVDRHDVAGRRSENAGVAEKDSQAGS